ncbi:MAG: hypothetical protein ACTSUE_23610 [Promethearchaeota archaeon]
MTSIITVRDDVASTNSLKVDTTRKYNVNAGQCEKCGFYKTWETRIKNERTGKMMPAHVNADGHLINDGECPYWTALKNKWKAGQGGHETRVQQDDARTFFNTPGRGPEKAKSFLSVNDLDISLSEGFVHVHFRGENMPTLKLDGRDAMKLIHGLLSLLVA